MLAIYKRELKAYFTTMIGYIYLTATLFFMGLYFFVENLYNGSPYYSYTIQIFTFILIFTIPFITMGMFAGEKKNGADRLTMTSPISTVSIVVGKYLAALTIFLIPCAISCIYPLILKRFGIVPMGEAYVALLAFVFYGASFIALGMFFSAIFKYKIVAAIVTFVVLFLGYIMASIIALFTNTENLFTDVVGLYDFSTPLNYMTNGVIDLKAIVYYVTLTVLFIFMTVSVINRRKIDSKNIKKNAINVIGILVAVAIFAVINISMKKVPDKYISSDYSYSGIFSLSDDTLEYLDTLEDDVSVYVLYSESGYDEYIAKMLDNYSHASSHVRVEYIDPLKYPRFYKNYVEDAPTEGSLIVEGSDNFYIIEYSYMYELDYTNYYYSGSAELSGFCGEGQLNNAINYVTKGNMTKIYTLTGHGETVISDSYNNAFGKSNVFNETVNLSDYDSIPGDVSGIIINGAVSDITADELNILENFLDNGGRILITLAVTDNSLDNINQLLDYMDIMQVKGLIIENDPNYYVEYAELLKPEMATTLRYTANLADYVLVPDAVGMYISENSDYVSYEKIFESTINSFLKVNYLESEIFNENEGDVEGPFVVGVEAKRQVTGDDGIITTPVMIVLASAGVFNSEFDAFNSNANQIFFESIVDSLAENGTEVSVPAKDFYLPYLTVPSTSRNVIVVITMLIIPICCLACGLYVCLKRKKC